MSEKLRDKPIPKAKKESVKELAEAMKNSEVVLIASYSGLPSSQFQQIKKELRGKANVKVVKKSIFFKAIDMTEKGMLQNLKNEVCPNFAVFISDMDAFSLSGLLEEKQSPVKAKPGDISPEDIEVEPGPTELLPGPAISELSGVGLKVAVKDGKLEIVKGAVVIRKNEKIDEKVASVLGKLDISPLQVGFVPLAVYDANDDKVYTNIKIDKQGTLEKLRELIGKAVSFAMKVEYVSKETLGYFISKAGMEEKALEKIVGEKKPAGQKTNEEKTSENNSPGKTDEEKDDDSSDNNGQKSKEKLEDKGNSATGKIKDDSDSHKKDKREEQ